MQASGTERRVIFAEPVDINEDEPSNEEEEVVSGQDDDIADDLPVRKVRKFDEDEMLAAKQELMLTRNFKLQKDFSAAYTGGTFALLKDGRFGLGLKDETVSLIHIDTGRAMGKLGEENEPIITFSVSPNQQILVTTTKNYTVKAYRMGDLPDPDSEQPQQWQPQNFQTFRLVGCLGLELSVDPGSRYAAVGTSDSQIKVYDLQKGFQTHNFAGHRGIVVKLAFLPQKGSLRLVSAAEDMLVKVWDMVLNSEIATIKGLTGGRATCFAFSNDYKTLFVGYRDGSVAFFHTEKEFKMIHCLKCDASLGFESEEEEVNALVYLNFGGNTSYLAIAGTSGKVVIIDLTSMEACSLEQSHIASEVIFMQQRKSQQPDGSPHGQLLVVNMDQNMFIYELEELKLTKGSLNKRLTMQKVASYCLYLDEVIDVRFIHRDSRFALLCSNSETLKLLDMHTRQVELYTGHEDIVLCLDVVSAADPNHAMLLSGAKDNTIRMWKFDATKPFQQRIECVATYHGHNENVSGVCFAPKKSKFFASVGQDNTLKVWNVDAEVSQGDIRSAQMTIMAHQKYINAVRVSPNDKLLATSSQDKTINIWQASSLQLKKTLKGHTSGIWDIQFAPTEQLLVSASGDKLCKVWNIGTGECLATLQGHSAALVKAAWLNAGLQVATASVDGIVKVWNFRKQQCQNTFEMHDEKIWAMDFIEMVESNDERDSVNRETLRMITGAGDSSVKVWTDSTLEEQVKEQDQKLKQLEEEQSLSKMLRDNDLVSASVLAFKLNKLRDFFHAMDRLVSGRAPPPRPYMPGIPGQVAPVLERSQDPIESILLNQEQFDQVLTTGKPFRGETKKQTEKNIAKVVSLLLQEDKQKLFDMVKKLNARQEYASMAQVIMREVLPRFDIEQLVSEFKQSNVALKPILEAMTTYSGKHFTRADRNLKRTFYVRYVLSQMTLLEDYKQLEVAAKEGAGAEQEEVKVMHKRDRKKKEKVEARARKATNLFKD